MAANCPKARSGPQRLLVFYFVGAMGIAVQLITLLILTHGMHAGYMVATGAGVEAAVLHNFFWHERWTWADRISPGSFWKRLAGFHLANGAVSLLGNLVLMRILVGHFGIDFICANSLAIALCSILNFIAGDRLVFRGK